MLVVTERFAAMHLRAARNIGEVATLLNINVDAVSGVLQTGGHLSEGDVARGAHGALGVQEGRRTHWVCSSYLYFNLAVCVTPTDHASGEFAFGFREPFRCMKRGPLPHGCHVLRCSCTATP